MAKRNRFEIMAEILSFCKEPKTKTKVMYMLNLSWQMAQRHLTHLKSRELLKVAHSSAMYVTTRKGLKFLELWNKLKKLL